MIVRTVLGDIAPEALGYCQCHEHIFLRKGQSFAINPALCMDSEPLSQQELADYRATGGHALVDAQPIGCGRMAGALQRASRASGVSIIASTGFHKLCFYPQGHWIFHAREEELAQLWTDEIMQGAFDSADGGAPEQPLDCRAGILKIALDGCGISGRYDVLTRAALSACRSSGAPLLCHVEKGADPWQLVRLMQRRGIAPQRLILCHLDRAAPDSHLHTSLAKEGVWLEFDTIARYKYHSDEAEIALIDQIAQAGYLHRLLLSLDTTNQRLLAYGGQIGLTYLLTVFLPALRQHGFSPESLTQITNFNPAQALAF